MGKKTKGDDDRLGAKCNRFFLKFVRGGAWEGDAEALWISISLYCGCEVGFVLVMVMCTKSGLVSLNKAGSALLENLEDLKLFFLSLSSSTL